MNYLLILLFLIIVASIIKDIVKLKLSICLIFAKTTIVIMLLLALSLFIEF